MAKSATASTALSVFKLSELLDYNPETGVLIWKVNRQSYGGKAKMGTRAGQIDKHGYRYIVIDGLVYWAHRLAWYMHYGAWPGNQIDHINMDFTDDRIVNLREATMTQQRANQRVRRDSKSGLKGVQQVPYGKWVARIRTHGIVYHLGRFESAEEAHAAYAAAAKRLFGDFARAE